MTHERDILRGSILNMRDLGGIAAAGGGRIPRGRVHRSAKLSGLSEADADYLFGEIGLRVVVDLRTAPEVARDGRPAALERLAATIVEAPLDEGDTRLRGMKSPQPRDYADSYLAMLGVIREPFRRVLEAVADSARAPLVFACTAGKDRTGVIAALLLLVAGAPDEAIAADYAASGPALLARIDSFRSHWERKKLSREDYAVRLDARPETMHLFLAGCRARYQTDDHLIEDMAGDSALVARARRALRFA